jgi:hypothetical protein
MQALIFDRARHGDVAAGTDQDVVRRAEDGLQDRSGGGHVDQLDPLVDVEHVPRCRAAAEREAVWKAACATARRTRRIDVQHGVDRPVARPAHALQLFADDRVAHDDETVAVEELCGAFDLRRIEHLEPADPVVLGELLAVGDDCGVVVVASPPCASRVAADQVVVLRRGLDVGQRRCVEAERIAVRRPE